MIQHEFVDPALRRKSYLKTVMPSETETVLDDRVDFSDLSSFEPGPTQIVNDNGTIVHFCSKEDR